MKSAVIESVAEDPNDEYEFNQVFDKNTGSHQKIVTEAFINHDVLAETMNLDSSNANNK